jgi:hypothetical protein
MADFSQKSMISSHQRAVRFTMERINLPSAE